MEVEKKCERCNRIVPSCQEMCRECSFEVYGKPVTPNEAKVMCMTREVE